MAITQDSAPGEQPRREEDGAPGGARRGNGDTSRNVFSILQFTGGMSINPIVRKYNEEVYEEAKKHVEKLETVMIQTPSGTAAYYVRRDNHTWAFLTVPAGSIPTSSRLSPSSERIADAIQEARRVIPGEVHVVTALLYHERDMYLAMNMANHIVTVLNTYSNPEIRNVGVEQLTADLDWVVDPSVIAAEEFVASQMPTKIRPPADFGFVFGVRRNRGRNDYGRYRDGRDDVDNVERLIGVTAYTEFLGPWKDRDGTYKFQPVIHGAITASPLMLPIVENLALAWLVQQGIMDRGWEQSFKRFTSDNGQNIGTLIKDPEDRTKLFRVKNMDQFDDMMRLNFFEPMLVMDVMDGYYRIPSRLCYANRGTNDSNLVVADAARFFDVGVPDLDNEPSRVIAKEYVGTYGEGEHLTDSRKFTYLEMAKRGAPEEDHAEIMLNYQHDERIRADLISDLNPGFRSEYLNQVCLIDPDYMSWLSGAIKASGMEVFNNYTRNSSVPMSGYASRSRDFSRFQDITRYRDNGDRDRFGDYRL